MGVLLIGITGTDPFLHFPRVDGEIRTGLKSPPDLAATNIEYRNR
jgi:hypothetical protein